MNFDLQTIWFLLVGVLLIAYLITDGFDFGVGILYVFLPKTDMEKRVLLKTMVEKYVWSKEKNYPTK
jgi:cytochrome d ubiquinol oxidase subunit II